MSIVPAKKSVSIPKDDPGTLQGRAHQTAEDIRQHQRAVSDRGTYSMPRGRARTDGELEAEFPAQYFPDHEKEDQRVALKAKLLADGKRPLGDAMMTDADLRWYQQKEEVKQQIIFDEWFSKLYDTTDPNKLRLAQELYPEYYQMREREIKRQAAIQEKVALIKLRGVADKDDLEFIFALQSGNIKLRAKPLYDLDNIDDLRQAAQQSKYLRGIFNPVKYSKGADSTSVPAFMGRGVFTRDGLVNSLAVPGAGNLPDIPFSGVDSNEARISFMEKMS